MDEFEKVFIVAMLVCVAIGFVVGYIFPNNIIAYVLTAIPAGLVVKTIMKRMLTEESKDEP